MQFRASGEPSGERVRCWRRRRAEAQGSVSEPPISLPVPPPGRLGGWRRPGTDIRSGPELTIPTDRQLTSPVASLGTGTSGNSGRNGLTGNT
jgi:hypothetical protein